MLKFSDKLLLEREYRLWVEEESEKVRAAIDPNRLTTMLTFLKHKGMLVEGAEKTKEVARARWVDRYGGVYDNPLYVCSECKEKALYQSKVDELGIWHMVQNLSPWCPHCGIEMEVE